MTNKKIEHLMGVFIYLSFYHIACLLICLSVFVYIANGISRCLKKTHQNRWKIKKYQ